MKTNERWTVNDAEVEFYKLLGRNVRRAREGGRLKQWTMAHMLGIWPSVLHKWEAGKTRMNAGDLTRIAQTLCVSLDVLLDGTREVAERVRLLRPSRVRLREAA